MLELLSIAFVILGTLTITLGTVGLLRAPSIYTRVHTSSKAVVLGVISYCAAAFMIGGADVRTRVVLIAIFLLITTPVASHIITQSAHRTGED